LFIGDPVPLVLRGKLGPVDISAVSVKIEALLDEKIEGVAITAPIIEGDEAGGRVDLSAIDFEKLAQMFASRPRTAAEKLRSQAEAKAHDMAARNPTRIHLVEKLEVGTASSPVTSHMREVPKCINFDARPRKRRRHLPRGKTASHFSGSCSSGILTPLGHVRRLPNKLGPLEML
jgi:hypothetical protein